MYRVTQEALTNVILHAPHADLVVVTVTVDANEITVDVRTTHRFRAGRPRREPATA